MAGTLQSSLVEARATYLSALRAEIRILIRAIVGDPDKNISTLKVKWSENGQDITLDYPRVVELIAQPDPADQAEVLIFIGKLQAARDSLIQQTKPATGYSIAYTSLVVGNERGIGVEGTNALARQAYGGLARPAMWHRWSIRFLATASVLIAIFASWEATKASLGRNLLQELEPLRAQQATLAIDKYKLETELIASNAPISKNIRPICEVYEALLKQSEGNVAASAALLPTEAGARIREVCGRDQILAHNFVLAHEGLRSYLRDWPDMVGGLYSPIAHMLGFNYSFARVGMTSANAQNASLVLVRESDGGDVEFRVAPVIQVITAYILPFTFGIIGSLLYVLLQHYMKVCANLLVPRDHAIAYTRVVLGIVVAASVSLLITSASGPNLPFTPSPSGSTPPTSLVGSLALSASLITFLAGFGAEAVFTLLQKLVQRVFALPDQS